MAQAGTTERVLTDLEAETALAKDARTRGMSDDPHRAIIELHDGLVEWIEIIKALRGRVVALENAVKVLRSDVS